MLTQEQIEQEKVKIDEMDQYQMARLWRFAPSDHSYFDNTNGDLSDYFSERFKKLGGFTPEISKSIGW